MPSSLKERREGLRLTQSEVAQRAGTTAAYISQIESGKVNMPNAELRRAISKALGIRHVDFLVAVGELGDWEVPGFSPTADPDPRLALLEALLAMIDLDSDSRAITLSGILQSWAEQDRARAAPPMRWMSDYLEAKRAECRRKCRTFSTNPSDHAGFWGIWKNVVHTSKHTSSIIECSRIPMGNTEVQRTKCRTSDGTPCPPHTDDLPNRAGEGVGRASSIVAILGLPHGGR